MSYYEFVKKCSCNKYALLRYKLDFSQSPHAGQELGAASSKLWVVSSSQLATKQGPQSYNMRNWVLPWSWMSLEDDPGLQRRTVGLADTLLQSCEILSKGSNQGMPWPLCTEMQGNQWVLLAAIRFVVICYTAVDSSYREEMTFEFPQGVLIFLFHPGWKLAALATEYTPWRDVHLTVFVLRNTTYQHEGMQTLDESPNNRGFCKWHINSYFFFP